MAPQNISFSAKLLAVTLLATLPSYLGLIYLMVTTGVSVYLTAMVGLVLLMLIAYSCSFVVRKTDFLFRTLSNLLEAMTNGDYSLRGRKTFSHSALGNLVSQINLLSETLARQKAEVKAQQLLLGKVINHIDVAILAFNHRQQLTLANPAAQALLGEDTPFDIDALRRSGKYRIHNDSFIEDGQTHQLWFITDVSQLLRAQERKAWQNLIRVLSHEINNSLTPIASLSQTLSKLMKNTHDSNSLRQDISDGLSLINQRANGLKTFIDGYRALSRLPTPQLQRVSLKPLLQKVILLFDKREIVLDCPPNIEVDIDPIQIEQLLINLLKNADEAMAKMPGKILIHCRQDKQHCHISIKDSGPGITNPSNLFIPFYTTKAGGSGTGLVLCRQIVEAHQGEMQIQNRLDAQGGEVKGCEVKLTL